MPWVFTHWPSREILVNLSDESEYTCVKFTSVQLGRHILLKAPDSPPSRPKWRMFMFSRNLAVQSECESSFLVMTQVGISSNADESLCRPFCGKLVLGNVSMYSRPHRGLLPYWLRLRSNYMDAPGDLVMVHFPCDSRNQCKGIFIHITERALLDPTLDLEICEVGPGYYSN